MSTQGKRRTVRNLAVFAVVVIFSGWLGRLLDHIMGPKPSQGIGRLI